jgi:hypothetical protein
MCLIQLVECPVDEGFAEGATFSQNRSRFGAVRSDEGLVKLFVAIEILIQSHVSEISIIESLAGQIEGDQQQMRELAKVWTLAFIQS